MFRYHLPHHRSINIVVIIITADIPQPVFKAKDTAFLQRGAYWVFFYEGRRCRNYWLLAQF
jgi:hypothetical protein